MKVLVLKSEEYFDQSVPESGGKTSVGTKLFLISVKKNQNKFKVCNA